MSETQLEMNFNPVAGNRIREALENGRFLTLIETQVPSNEMDRSSAVKRIEALGNAVFNNPDMPDTAIAIIDNSSRPDWRAIELAAALPENDRDHHLVCLSGAGLDKKGVMELVQMAENAGIYNIIPVSGDIPEKIKSAKECRKIPFTESCDILRILAERKGKFFTGAAVNPYQYTPYTLLGSYYKMMKKFNCGANFLITQTGWDMLKLQSLAWYLTGRDMHYPKIARLTLLSPERLDTILNGGAPGIKISKDMKKLLDKELVYSKNQFEATQYRRLELQAAGCRLLGFSGIEISGADNPAKTGYVLSRISTALKEYRSFEMWLDEYNAFMASTEMAPYSWSFQLYDRMLYRNYPFDDQPETRELPAPYAGFAEKTALRIKSFLFSHADRQRSDNARYLKALLAGCTGCNKCCLPQKNYICPYTCPMQLKNGICGSVNPDGSCPLTRQECVHHKVLRLAHLRNKLPEQENIILSDD